jgi:hypothetical protein
MSNQDPTNYPEQPLNNPQYQAQYPPRPPQYPNQPPYGYHAPNQPPPWPPKPSKLRALSTQAKVIIAASVAVFVLLIVLVAVNRSDGHGSSESAAAGSGHLIGSMDDWLTAVCQPGHFHNGTNFQSAVGGGACPTPEIDRGHDVVFFLQYNSRYLLVNDLKMHALRYYAVGVRDDGTIIAFAARFSPNALKPLTEFGFVIEPV